MAVKASPEVIREMKNDISNAIRDLSEIGGGIRRGVASLSSWDDGQAAQFRAIMKKVAMLAETPLGTLNGSLPKLEQLAQALDRYNRVRF